MWECGVENWVWNWKEEKGGGKQIEGKDKDTAGISAVEGQSKYKKGQNSEQQY